VIEYTAPVAISAAINDAWYWRRLFNQMSMTRLRFTGLAVRASRDPAAICGNLYLPSAAEDLRRDEPAKAEAYYMPLNRWAERERLANAMARWLAAEEPRKMFRASVDRVLENTGQQIVLQDVVELCSGIDSLDELDDASGQLPREVLAEMAAAAAHAAGAKGKTVEDERIRGVLGNLGRRSPRARLRQLTSTLDPPVSEEDFDRLWRLVGRYRQAGAHGVRLGEEADLQVAPTIEALAALCARYDLESAGVPNRTASDAPSMPLVTWRRAMTEIATLAAGVA
jgi:hypothetical protein